MRMLVMLLAAIVLTLSACTVSQMRVEARVEGDGDISVTVDGAAVSADAENQAEARIPEPAAESPPAEAETPAGYWTEIGEQPPAIEAARDYTPPDGLRRACPPNG